MYSPLSSTQFEHGPTLGRLRVDTDPRTPYARPVRTLTQAPGGSSVIDQTTCHYNDNIPQYIVCRQPGHGLTLLSAPITDRPTPYVRSVRTLMQHTG